MEGHTVRRRSRESWATHHFHSPPHLGWVLLYGALAALALGYGSANLLRGKTSLSILSLGFFLSLFAFDNWRRWTEAEESKLLPRRFLCPDCDAPIELSTEDRKKSTFHCDSCREDFEVDG